jgi:hypothetical protein
MIDRLPEGDVLPLFCVTYLSGVATHVVYAKETVTELLSGFNLMPRHLEETSLKVTRNDLLSKS